MRQRSVSHPRSSNRTCGFPHEKIQRRVEYDLYYIENWSVLFDLFILAKTPIALATTENAF